MNSDPISVVGRSARTKMGPSQLLSLLLAAILGFILVPGIFVSQSAVADNPPRKILSGWLPYYATASGLSSLNANADLIQEVNHFGLLSRAQPRSPIFILRQIRICPCWFPFR